jgi:hypothetical protein
VTGSRPNTTTIPTSSITPRDPSLLAGTISALLETFAHNSELLENITDEPRALIGSAESRARVAELVHDAVGRCCGQQLHRDVGIHLAGNEGAKDSRALRHGNVQVLVEG